VRSDVEQVGGGGEEGGRGEGGKEVG